MAFPPTRRPSPVLLLVGATAAAGAAVKISGTSANLLHDPTAPGIRPVFVLAVLIAVVMAWRKHGSVDVAVVVAAALGIRVLFGGQLRQPIPAIEWARGMEVMPPERIIPLLMSGSVFGVGQLASLAAWASLLPAAMARTRGLRLVVLVAGGFATLCALSDQPMILNELHPADAESFTFPAYEDGQVVERTWIRKSEVSAPAISRIALLWQSDQALAALSQGMSERTHGASWFRRGLWRVTAALTGATLALRVACVPIVLLGFPAVLVATLRQIRVSRFAPIGRWLRLPALVLLAILAGSNIGVTLLAALLPEGHAAALWILPFHFAFAGFIGAAFASGERALERAASGVTP